MLPLHFYNKDYKNNSSELSSVQQTIDQLKPINQAVHHDAALTNVSIKYTER